MTDPEAKSSNELATERTEMAAERTIMAADRTLMAWVRTSLSLMSFGFTIYKLLQGFQSSGAALPNTESPRRLGLFLTALGAASVIMGAIEYVAVVRDLRRHKHYKVLRPSFVMALLMAAASLFLFVGILVKVL